MLNLSKLSLDEDADPPPKEPTFCRPCKLSFSSWEMYRSHMLTSKHHSNCCEICIIDFRCAEAFKNHHDLMHSKEQNLTCPHCNLWFPRLGGLMAHFENSQCRAKPDTKLESLEEIRKFKQLTFENQKAIREFKDFSRGAPANSFVDEPHPFILQVDKKNASNVIHEDDLISLDPKNALWNHEPETVPNMAIAGNKYPRWHENAVTQETELRLTRGSIHPSGDFKAPSTWGSQRTTFSETARSDELKHRYDPSNPGFQAQKYFNQFLNKYKCPHPGCRKSLASKSAFIKHLTSPAHRDEKLQCHNCLRYYSSATALTQHCESQGARCKIRKLDNYDEIVDRITAGTVKTAGILEDNTIRYAVRVAAGETSATETAIGFVAQHVQTGELQGKGLNAYWGDKRPDW